MDNYLLLSQTLYPNLKELRWVCSGYSLLTGYVTYGETIDEAIEMTKEAIESLTSRFFTHFFDRKIYLDKRLF